MDKQAFSFLFVLRRRGGVIAIKFLLIGHMGGRMEIDVIAKEIVIAGAEWTIAWYVEAFDFELAVGRPESPLGSKERGDYDWQ
ncbi:MAG: hypothetical protein BWY75_03532 [bacterium ADurb.Bin425]|nr:MAG: hypothetical protein BWY75_03532 [bacterium ADurb.Bin425]